MEKIFQSVHICTLSRGRHRGEERGREREDRGGREREERGGRDREEEAEGSVHCAMYTHTLYTCTVWYITAKFKFARSTEP